MAAVSPAPVELSNWNITQFTTPSAVVEVFTLEDVQRVVRDAHTYPTPVLPVCGMRSVTGCVTNDGGTLLNVKGAARAPVPPW